MEYKGGPYERDPYGRNPSDAEDGGYAGEASRGGASYERGYDTSSPYSRSPYGQQSYGAARGDEAGQDAYGGGPYSREYASAGYGRGDSRGPSYDRGGEREEDYDRGYDRGEERRRGYARGGEEPDSARGGHERRNAQGDYARRDMQGDYAQDGYAQDDGGYGRDGYAQGDGGYGRDGYAQDGYGRDDARGGYARRSERDDYARHDAQGDYSPSGYDRDARARQAYDDADASARSYGRDDGLSQTARTRMQRDGDLSQTARTRMQRDDGLSQTARIRMQRESARYDADADAETEAYDEDEEIVERPKKKRKKRSKLSRFIRGLGAYIAQLPAKTLVIFGGSVAVILVGVILLVMLLPNAAAEPSASDGQLGLMDVPTPTPSLPPTEPPAATEELPAETPFDNPFANDAFLNVNDENDLVPTIQERLVELGYMDLPSDGYTTKYGPATKTAVRIFQIRNIADYHDWDGLMGASTYEKLMSDTAAAFYLARGDGDDRTKDITRLVELVNKLQTRLIELGYLKPGGATGRYGEDTVNAVRLFQEYHGLKVDGQAGQSTLKLIYTAEAMDAVTGKANNRTKAATPAPAGDATTGTPDPNAAAASPAAANATPAA